MCHGTDKYGNTAVRGNCSQVRRKALYRGIVRQSDFVGVRREIIGYWVLDNPQQFFRAFDRTDTKAVKQLDHQATKPFEGTRDSDLRIHFDQHALGGVNVYLKKPCLVQRRIEQC